MKKFTFSGITGRIIAADSMLGLMDELLLYYGDIELRHNPKHAGLYAIYEYSPIIDEWDVIGVVNCTYQADVAYNLDL